MKRKIIILMGVSGSGKTTLAPLIAKQLPGHIYIDSERQAFNKNLFEESRNKPFNKTLHQKIIKHCIEIAQSWTQQTDNTTFIIDRWYETYFIESGLSQNDVHLIEQSVLDLGFEAVIFNLLIENTLHAMIQRQKHTCEERNGPWWNINIETFEERALFDLNCQNIVKNLGQKSLFSYYELNTTDMNWDNITNQVISKFPEFCPQYIDYYDNIRKPQRNTRGKTLKHL